MHFKSCRKSKFTLLVLFAIGSFPSIGQQRNADRIVTVKKDTLTVNILEVGLTEIKYKEADNGMIHLVSKAKVLKVFYGNGETEEFLNFAQYQDKSIPDQTDLKYYKMVVATPFQKSIAQWSDQKLFAEQKRFQNISSTTLFLGITSIVTGSVLFGYGIATIFDSGQAHEFMRGGIFTGTLGIPLLAFQNKFKKKRKFISMEIERRSFRQGLP